MTPTNKEHWETVYQTKQPNERGWTQAVPEISLKLIHSFNLPKSAPIIDVGGGDSLLADCLLTQGFTNITVLDISETALKAAQARLGSKAQQITWIVSDITRFQPQQSYELWHDRAVFHFLTTPQQVDQYVEIAKKAASKYLVVGTFSETGPKKCSGLDIKQYNEKSLPAIFETAFYKLECLPHVHTTPFGTTQNFIFCSFRHK